MTSDAITTSGTLAVGDVIGPLVVGPVAHGGHCVVRHEGRVLFVRHVLPGETVRVRITAIAARHAFADAVTIDRPAAERVVPACPVAGECGGCDLQHATPAFARELKRRVVAEQLQRLAGWEWEGRVEAVTPDALGWRTRMRYHAGPQGWGMRAHRSDAVVPLPPQGCRLAVPALARPRGAVGVASADGVRWDAAGGSEVVTERAAGRTWRVAASGFWQVHPQAADTLAAAVLSGLAPRAGERALDLYCGVGLFSGVLADAGVTVRGIEGDRRAVALARRNVPEAEFACGPVEALVRRERRPYDLVVLDPPRVGARRPTMEAVAALATRRIAYVACDPAALARDLATASELGWEPASVRAFDLFPSTHHVECVAILEPR